MVPMDASCIGEGYKTILKQIYENWKSFGKIALVHFPAWYYSNSQFLMVPLFAKYSHISWQICTEMVPMDASCIGEGYKTILKQIYENWKSFGKIALVHFPAWYYSNSQFLMVRLFANYSYIS